MKKMFEEKEFDAMVRVMENGDHGAVFRTTVIREIDDFIAEKLSLPNIQNKKTQSK
jgi:hypothetical protein